MITEDKLKNSPAIPFLLVPPEPARFSESLDLACRKLPERHRPVMESFRKNCHALTLTMYLPFKMCLAAAERERYSKVLAAERIRMLMPVHEGLPEEEKERRAAELATEKFAVECASDPGKSAIFVHAFFHFEELARDASIAVAFRELMRQGIVGAWSAIEALANDLFCSLVNEKPALSDLLFQDDRTKKRFQIRDPMSILVSHDYNLSGHMGDALNRSCKLDDVDAIRCVFDTLFPDDKELRLQLADERLWKLFQRRNLIVHRRSIVDHAYLDNTGESLSLGSELPTTASDVDKAMAVVVRVGMELLSTVGKTNRREEHSS